MNDALRQAVEGGMSTEEAHLIHDMTKLAFENALDAIQTVSDRCPREMRATIKLGALGSLMGFLKAASPSTFAGVLAIDLANVKDGLAVIELGRD